jgi:hypothetical protein
MSINECDHAELFRLVDAYGAAAIACEPSDIARFLAHLSARNAEMALAEVELRIGTIWEEAHAKLVELEEKDLIPR